MKTKHPQINNPVERNLFILQESIEACKQFNPPHVPVVKKILRKELRSLEKSGIGKPAWITAV